MAGVTTLGFAKLFQKQMESDIQARIDTHQKLMRTIRPNLNFIATGDSWFDYPLDGDMPGIRTDVLSALPKVMSQHVEILSLAHYGYTSTQEMGLARQTKLVDQLKDTRNGKFDGILISAGGNDVAGDALCIWLNEKGASTDWTAALNVKRFVGVLDMIEASYRDLIAIRNQFLPGAPIFAHSYDHPLANGKGVCHIGPWLKPSFDFCGWTNENDANAVLVTMMNMFASVIQYLADEAGSNFIHVKTQGTLTATQWTNELHPNPVGFTAIAKKFSDEISKHFDRKP